MRNKKFFSGSQCAHFLKWEKKEKVLQFWLSILCVFFTFRSSDRRQANDGSEISHVMRYHEYMCSNCVEAIAINIKRNHINSFFLMLRLHRTRRRRGVWNEKRNMHAMIAVTGILDHPAEEKIFIFFLIETHSI